MSTMNIAWGVKVSDTFLDRLAWLVDDLNIGYGTEDGMNKMMGCMAWESDRTFSASVLNKAGSGATGLIQFMPATAKTLDTTTAALAKMTPEDQLNYVWKYFAPYKNKLETLADIYAAILWPKGIGKPDNFVYWEKGVQATAYRQNIGIDTNKDGAITKAEATAKVTALYEEGFKEGNVRWYTPKVEREVPNITYPEAVDYSGYDEVNVPPVAPGVAERFDWMKDTKPNEPIVSTISKAAAGWQGNFAGIALVVGALFTNPQFADALGKFTVRLANGEGSWGALAALVGAGLIAYRGSQSK